MNKQDKINKVLDSPEFLIALKKLDEEQRKLVENSARELLGDLFESMDGAMSSVQKMKSREKMNEPLLDDSNITKEKE